VRADGLIEEDEMRKDKYAPGEPCWIDCGTELDKATAFYAGLFGWNCVDTGIEMGNYHMAMLGDAVVAGLGPKQNPGPPSWAVYFCTHNAEHTAEKVVANGGTVVVPPMDVASFGRLAVLQDTVGAYFSVWEPGETKGVGLVDEPGTLTWVELISSDQEESIRFYGEVFGWEKSEGEDNSMEYTEFTLGVTSIAGMMPRPDAMPAEVPNYWGLYFAVDDCDESVAKVAELGGATVVGPMTIPVGRWATCTDSAGAMFSMIAMSAG
jgi:predicted enzyme related to lactoylglutathione lyase